MILAGDLGGTNARLAVYDARGRRRLAEANYASGNFRSVGDLLRRFFADHPRLRPARASLGIAGPVEGHRCVTTNLPWVVDARALARRFGLESVRLHNDMVALAHGCLHAAPAERSRVVGSASPSTKRGVVAVVAAGTGLGECFLVPSDGGVVSMPTEGGHADFAPRSDEECELLAFARARFGRVSAERILCGDGLALVHAFVRAERGLGDVAAEASLAPMHRSKRAIELARIGSPAARHAVRLFSGLLGAELGNAALRGLARGGVFLSGGLGAAVFALEPEVLREAYLAKGRFRGWLEGVPLTLVARTDVGLDGSARLAAS